MFLKGNLLLGFFLLKIKLISLYNYLVYNNKYMVLNLRKNILLKNYFKKPNFLTDKEISEYLYFLKNNQKDLFLDKITLKATRYNFSSSKIFQIYFYFLTCLEKDNQKNIFIKNYVFSKLKNKMMIFNENFAEKEIYSVLKKNKISLNKKIKPLTLTKNLYNALQIYERLEDYIYDLDFASHNDSSDQKIKPLKKKIQLNTIKFIDLLKKDIKNKKISKKDAYDIIISLDSLNTGVFFKSLKPDLEKRIISKKLF